MIFQAPSSSAPSSPFFPSAPRQACDSPPVNRKMPLSIATHGSLPRLGLGGLSATQWPRWMGRWVWWGRRQAVWAHTTGSKPEKWIGEALYLWLALLSEKVGTHVGARRPPANSVLRARCQPFKAGLRPGPRCEILQVST